MLTLIMNGSHADGGKARVYPMPLAQTASPGAAADPAGARESLAP
jgi:hypothetical protein